MRESTGEYGKYYESCRLKGLIRGGLCHLVRFLESIVRPNFQSLNYLQVNQGITKNTKKEVIEGVSR